MEALINIINSVAFPIAAFVLVFWSWREDQKSNDAERGKWIDAINNNTEIMKDIKEILKDESRSDHKAS